LARARRNPTSTLTQQQQSQPTHPNPNPNQRTTTNDEQSGRQTLENAIRLVESHPDWRARVVYGDTGEGD